ncbi:ras GTPase-activating protein raskol [Lucilia cuprina]|uniref:ras GTPase-activating protein raskol n=1 Tax=Lucilia cuprina TaxID=7375 RepID=UPI001F059499|nr:ras GTPase-activating protein raskol [Lucilia cuprina]
MAMHHNSMFPGTATKFQTRPASPQFASFSPPSDYPHVQAQATVHLHNQQQQQQKHLQQQQQLQQMQQHHLPQQQYPSHGMSMRHPGKSMNAGSSIKSRSNSSSAHHMVNSNTMTGGMLATMSSGGSLGHHRGDLIFPDEMDSIEFCMPPAPGPSNGMGHGVSSEMLLVHGKNGLCTGEAFTERRRRGHSRRSNHKMDVEQQVKWSRKNIAATMERFEPTQHHSSSSTSSLEYGFAASVVTPSSTPSHHSQQQISPAPSQTYQGGAAAVAASSNSAGPSGSTPYNHVYSYAYYEPGAAKCHINIPQKDEASAIVPAPLISAAPPSKSPTRNSIRALLAKSFRSKSNSGQSTSSSPSGTDERHTYTTRYGTTENLYEEVNDQKIRKVLSDNRIATSNVKEELRRVQHNHFRVLDELNLSLEALIMPETPPDVSPNQVEDDEGPSTSAAAAAVASATSRASVSSGSHRGPRRGGLLGGAASSSSSTVSSSQQRTLSHASLENLSSTLNSIELKDHTHSSCINPEFDEGDLDSGFSGSGSSSGASYNESLRYYKTGPTPSHQHHNHHAQQHQLHQHAGQHHLIQPTTLPHNMRSCRSSTASGTSTSKSSMVSSEDQGIGMMTSLGSCGTAVTSPANGHLLASPFNFARRSSDTQRASGRSASDSSATGAKPKKNFWKLKP